MVPAFQVRVLTASNWLQNMGGKSFALCTLSLHTYSCGLYYLLHCYIASQYDRRAHAFDMHTSRSLKQLGYRWLHSYIGKPQWRRMKASQSICAWNVTGLFLEDWMSSGLRLGISYLTEFATGVPRFMIFSSYFSVQTIYIYSVKRHRQHISTERRYFALPFVSPFFSD